MNKKYNNLFYTFATDLSSNNESVEFNFAKKYKFLKTQKIYGINGQCYSIPIRNSKGVLMPLSEISNNINKFKEYALQNPQINFQITKIACKENEYSDFQIAPLFKGLSDNCLFPFEWYSYLNIYKKMAIFFEEDFEDINFLNQTLNHFTQNLNNFRYILNDSNLNINNFMENKPVDILPITKHYSESNDFSKIINAKEIIIHSSYILILKSKESIFMKNITNYCKENNLNYRVIDYNKKLEKT